MTCFAASPNAARLTAIVLIALPLLGACDRSDSDAGPRPSAVAPAPSARVSELGHVRGSVSYAGHATGPSVYVGLFRDGGGDKPVGAPDYAQQIKWPDFPVTYSFRDVPAGKYVVMAYLSANGEHPTAPDVATDPVAPFAPVIVTVGAAVKQDLTLSGP